MMRMMEALLGLLVIMQMSAPAVVHDAPQKAKMNALLVYGNGFMFGVTEPDGWVGDTSDKATRRVVNIIFFPKDKASKSQGVKVMIRISPKVDENTADALLADIAGYKRKFPSLEQEDLSLQHPEYKTIAKLIFTRDSLYEYIAYLNPGPGTQFVFSVVLYKTRSRASKPELQAFEEVLKSVRLLSAPGFKVIKG